MAAASDQGRPPRWSGRQGGAAGDDEAQERHAAGDLQPSSALLLLGRQSREGHVPAREHARRPLADHQAQRAAEHGQGQDAHVARRMLGEMGAQPQGTPSDRHPAVPGASDAQLLRAIATGSEAAFVELRGRYGQAVARVCRKLADSDREDCEQEVFARIWRKAALFDPARGSAAAWLLTLARRTALNLRAVRRPPTPIGDEVVLGTVEPPEVEAFWRESAIASRLRVPLGSVKSWKRRGLNRLATLLGEESP